MTRSPIEYKEAAALALEAGEEMLSRLEWMTIKPRVILDIGCGPGALVEALNTRFPEASVYAIDNSEEMLAFAKIDEKSAAYICADAARLPLASQSVDLIVVNMLVPWHKEPAALLHEWRRLLRANGLLMFTALGPDSLKEIPTIFQRHDMHDLGDLMVQEGFSDPVLDINYYTLSYQDKQKLCRELEASGMVDAANESLINELDIQFEVVFAHAFTPAETDEISPSSDGVVRIPLAHLRRRLSGSL